MNLKKINICFIYSFCAKNHEKLMVKEETCVFIVFSTEFWCCSFLFWQRNGNRKAWLSRV